MKTDHDSLIAGRTVKGLTVALVLVLAGAAASAFGQLLPGTLGIDTTTTVDENNQVLEDGDLVQILWASNNIPYPPDYDGNPDPRTAPVADISEPSGITNACVRIGDGLVPGAPGYEPGSIVVLVSNTVRDAGVYLGIPVFVRVFNASTATGASFYGEAAPQPVPEDGHLYFNIDKTRYALDTRDNDGDGLNNSWEESGGTDVDNPHSDTDGVNDWEEWVAGTDGRDPDSVFILARIQQGAGDEAVVAWDSVAGKRYEVYYTTDPLDAEDPPPTWSKVSGTDPITATAALTELPVSSGLAAGRGHFRVVVLQDE